MHRWLRLSLLAFFVSGLAPATLASPSRCPMTLTDCVAVYGQLRERPWLGFEVATDPASGARVVQRVLPGGPAEAAGVRAGDVLRAIGGREPQLWFASYSVQPRRWRGGERVELSLVREAHALQLAVELRDIPDDVLAQVIGEHVLHAHVPYMEDAYAHDPEP